MSHPKPVLGIVGGIGSGKSAVAAEFARLGCLVIDSDRLSHEIMNRPSTVETLRQWWGAEVLAPDGRPDRDAIARRIFASGDQKARLESYLYPLIADDRAHMMSDGFKDPAVKAIILDSPLLLENRLDRLCDAILFVETDEANRVERVRAARGWTAAELARRERWQMPLDQKRARSTFVIPNNGSPDALRSCVIDILERIRTAHSTRTND